MVGHLRNHGLKIFFLIAPFPVICQFVFQGPYTYSVLYNDLLADLKIETTLFLIIWEVLTPLLLIIEVLL